MSGGSPPTNTLREYVSDCAGEKEDDPLLLQAPLLLPLLLCWGLGVREPLEPDEELVCSSAGRKRKVESMTECIHRRSYIVYTDARSPTPATTSPTCEGEQQNVLLTQRQAPAIVQCGVQLAVDIGHAAPAAGWKQSASSRARLL